MNIYPKQWNVCAICESTNVPLFKIYKSRGHFPYKTGGVCERCMKKIERSGKKPKNREEFLEVIKEFRREVQK